jgi:SAM-dependent methyltransferase
MSMTVEANERLHSCPLCGGAAYKPLPVPGRWVGSDIFTASRSRLGLVRCLGCGLVFTNPRPTPDLLSSFYSGDTYCCHSTGDSVSAGARADFLLERISQHMPPGAPRTLLDYGAGGGGFLAHAAGHGWQVSGYEPGRRGFEACRQAGFVVTNRLEELRTRDFSLITLHHVLEHLADPVAALTSIRRLLAPNGRLFLEVPNARSLRARLAHPLLSRFAGVDERYRAFPIHLFYFSERHSRSLLAKAGWEVDTIFTTGLGMDEFFFRPDDSPRPLPPGRPMNSASRVPRKRLRHFLRDRFLALGLGENLAVIAHADS